MKNILIISANYSLSALAGHFDKLSQKGLNLYFLLNKPDELSLETDKQQIKKHFFVKEINSFFALPEFMLKLPFYTVTAVLMLAKYKFKKKIETLILFSLTEMIIFFLPAKVLGLRVVLLGLPGHDLDKKNKIIILWAGLFIKKADVVTFIGEAEKELKKIKIIDNIRQIGPGIEIKTCHQDNIFLNLARAGQKNQNKKFFTLGTITCLDDRQTIETLFRAAKLCLNVIPNLQIIIIGEGKERKNLSWLSKKLGLENLVWFVGKQKYLKKWLLNLDLYIVACSKLELSDINRTLEAMAAKLPVIGPPNIGLENIIDNGRTGIILDSPDGDCLAGSIIKLKQNSGLRQLLKKQSYEKVKDSFSLEDSADKLYDILIKP